MIETKGVTQQGLEENGFENIDRLLWKDGELTMLTWSLILDVTWLVLGLR